MNLFHVEQVLVDDTALQQEVVRLDRRFFLRTTKLCEDDLDRRDNHPAFNDLQEALCDAHSSAMRRLGRRDMEESGRRRRGGPHQGSVKIC
jgi:hypothetical protein